MIIYISFFIECSISLTEWVVLEGVILVLKKKNWLYFANRIISKIKSKDLLSCNCYLNSQTIWIWNCMLLCCKNRVHSEEVDFFQKLDLVVTRINLYTFSSCLLELWWLKLSLLFEYEIESKKKFYHYENDPFSWFFWVAYLCLYWFVRIGWQKFLLLFFRCGFMICHKRTLLLFMNLSEITFILLNYPCENVHDTSILIIIQL